MKMKNTSFFQEIQRMFLCCYPLHCIDWQKFPKDLEWLEHKILLDYTCNTAINQEMPVKLTYQMNFLKRLINYLEMQTSEVHDALYEKLCDLQSQLPTDLTEKFAFKHYQLANDKTCIFSIKESKSFVADGTTGLCSWPAALALADYFIHNSHILRQQNVLELGSGTGVCGIIVFKFCQPKHLLLTDGSLSCIDLMNENIQRNYPKYNKLENNKFHITDSILQCCKLNWQGIEEVQEVRLLKPNIIFASDILYDDTIFDDLIKAIDYIFQLNDDKVQMYLAATVRNEFTIGKFQQRLKKLNFHISECPVISSKESKLYWDRTTTVKILLITR